MPNKCGVVNCRGNYNKENRRRTVSLVDIDMGPTWGPCGWPITAHGPTWAPRGPHLTSLLGIFNVSASCLPSPKLTPRPAKPENQQLRYFLQKDKITSSDDFKPERNLQKQYKNLIISRSKERLFDETVRLAMYYDITLDKMIQNVVTLLQAHTSTCVDTEKVKKLVFLTRQLELLSQKQFSMNDCFSFQSYPKCNYEQLRDFLVLPCKRKQQYITSSINKDQVLRETFDKVQTLQLKNVFLLVDEVQIHPTVQFSGGVLSGMAENNRDYKVTSMLCVMRKSLHKGPSLMISLELTLTVPRCSIVWQMFY
ncbi:hypothetical protein FHG87_013159 [Trinorchestia longiramus]|nr:hypothetical protein FHG87_013159 [Trinorchestia longiramus]